VDLESSAYSFLPNNTKLTDQLKEKITIGHLLSMTSGIAEEAKLASGISTKIDSGPFEHALGFSENQYGKKQML